MTALPARIIEIINQRIALRALLIDKMKTAPTMSDSETLRKLEDDITFWNSRTDQSISGLIATLNESFKLEK